ncbi:F-box/LRR-repeat protein 7-like [Pectinophora gossypiella]|uniref:F-box domain-containing protein n=1 Tax=Pectinophora gossypiella TaxID=13191 RepID=A0A1E1WIC0_PECGO|nr:F-box/LRR-repeat protein 7-like [Pectinophora gossypiella]
MTGSGAENYDEINVLPDELLIYIFKYLPLEAILVCENVSQRWQKLARDPLLWKHLPLVYSGKPGQSEVSARNLEIISTHYEYISCLKLQYIYSYPMISSILDKMANLVCLELVMCRVAKGFENILERWPNLKKFSLKNSLQLQSVEDLLIRFDRFEHLKYLALSEFGLNANNCNSLLHCKQLTHIFIEKIRDLPLEFVSEFIKSKQEILHTLHIYGGNGLDDNCVMMLSKCPHLTDLAIIRCENLTDIGLIALVNLKKIEHLQIWNNNKFTEDKLLKTLSSPSLVTLKSLSLSRISNVSPVVVDVISESYKNLKFLAVYQCARIINTDYEKQLKSKFRNIEVVLY